MDCLYSNFKKDLSGRVNRAGIENQIEAMVKPTNNKQLFYQWLLRCNNIYISDNDQMAAAFEKINN
jgi:hypothetical protein